MFVAAGEGEEETEKGSGLLCSSKEGFSSELLSLAIVEEGGWVVFVEG